MSDLLHDHGCCLEDLQMSNDGRDGILMYIMIKIHGSNHIGFIYGGPM